MYCCTTNTDAVAAKSDEANKSPIAPSSGHSLQSVSPAVSGEIVPWPLPTMKKRSWALSIDLIAATVSSPLFTIFSMYVIDPSFAVLILNSFMYSSSRSFSFSSSALIISILESLGLGVVEPPTMAVFIALSPGMNLITVRLTPGCSDILQAYASASRSSGPPKKSTTTWCDTWLAGTRVELLSPRSTRIPMEQGALARTFVFTIRKAGCVVSIPPSIVCCLWKGMIMKVARLSSARWQISSCIVEYGEMAVRGWTVT